MAIMEDLSLYVILCKMKLASYLLASRVAI